MIKLEQSEVLCRMIRQDDVKELAIPTWDVVRKAMAENNIHEALRFLEYGCQETKTVHDGLCSLINSLFDSLAAFDEAEAYKVLRTRYEPVIERWLAQTPDVERSLQRCVEYQRSHGGSCVITEEEDKYVVRCDPCGSGGQLRRMAGISTVKTAHSWTWHRSDIPYYCAHCCIMWEIIPIELRGYPIRITVPGNEPYDPCIHHYYKDRKLIPAEYFSGMSGM
jgi:hypothetical protein